MWKNNRYTNRKLYGLVVAFTCLLIAGPIMGQLGKTVLRPAKLIFVATGVSIPNGGYANGGTAKIEDDIGTQSQSWEMQIQGTAPASTSITITGVMRGGTVSTTPTTSSSTVSTVLTSNGLWDKYTILASWTGGDATTTISFFPTMAVAVHPSGGGAGNVITNGTPAANQFPVWTDATHIKGVTANGDATISGSGLVTNNGIKGNLLPALSVGFINWNGSAWVMSTAAIAGAVQGEPLTGQSGGGATSSSVYWDTAAFPSLTGSGAHDVCLEAVATENAYVTTNASAGQIIVPVNNKAYCSVLPQAPNFHGDIYFVGNSARARIYTSVSWTGFSSGIHIHGTGPQGTSVNTSFNVQLIACSKNLHGNLYPGTQASAPCPAYFDSSTNMPQATVSSITTAAGGHSTVTLTGVFSGTIAGTFAGLNLCIGKETPTPGNGNCYMISAEPTGGNTIFVVNSTSLVACVATCGGKAYIETALINESTGTGSTPFFVHVSDMGTDCSYVYACANLVNGAAQEGSYFRNIQMFNGTVFGYRKFVGNNTSPASYGGNSGGSDHSGPDMGLYFNYQSVTCENTVSDVQAGCYGTNGTFTTAGHLFASGTLMACGDNTVLIANQAILSYSSTVAVSTCQKNMAGIVSDGIAMGTNSNSIYGIFGFTSSLKDVFNSGSHVRMPEITNGLGVFANGAANLFLGWHVEYTNVCQEIGGNAAVNESWIADNATLSQSITFINGDSNNCPTRNFDLGTAGGTTNVMNLTIIGFTGGNGTTMLKNNFMTGEDCTNAAEKNLYYIFEQTATSARVDSDCSSANVVIPQPLINLPANFSETAYCVGAVNATTGTYALNPFQTGITSIACATLLANAGTAIRLPVTTAAGLCNLNANSGANATATVTFTLNNVTQVTSATVTIGAGANNGSTTSAALAFTKNDSYNITMNVGTSDAITSPRVKVVCW